MKRKLLFAALCAVGAWVNTYAEDWTDKTSVITNPSFETDAAISDLTTCGWATTGRVTGWTIAPSSPGNSQVGVGNSSSTIQGIATSFSPSNGDKYFYMRENWNPNTTFSISQTIPDGSIPAGIYRLTVKAAMFSSVASTYTLSLQEEGQTAATNSFSYKGTANSESWKDWSVMLIKRADDTDLIITAAYKTPSENSGGKHYALLLDDFKLELLNPSNATDLTSLINNAVVTGTSGWTNGRINSGQQYTGAPDNTYMDTWNAELDQKQTIKLPAGYYLLKAATRSSAYASGNIYAYVTEDDETFRTDIHKEGAEGNLLGGGWAWTRVPVTVTQSSDVTIGFWSNCTGGQWAGADNFNLVYYDSELNQKAALFEQVRSDATTWKTALDASITTGAKNGLAAEDEKSYTSVAEYNEAITRLEEAITFARTTYPTLKAKYDAVKAAVQALPDQTTVYTGSATIDVDEVEADALVEAATSESGINAAILIWRNAAATFLGSVTVNDGQFFDITSIFLDNADFSDGTIGGWETNYVSGQQAQNIGYQGSSYTNDDVTINQFIEAWKPKPGTLGDGYLRQTVSNLPEGKYILEADAISVQQQDENEEVTGSYLYIYADGVDTKTALNTLNNKPLHFSREFLNTGAGDVVFGLKTESSTGNWLCADNFTVKFYGVDLSAYETQLAEAVTAAEAVTGIPAGAASVLTSVVNANNQTYNSSSAYAAAISAIQTATATALSFQTPLANYNTAKETAEDFEEETMFDTDWSALQGVITSNTVDLSSTSITVDALNTATENLVAANTAATAAVEAKTTYDEATSIINGGKNVDLTSLITNPSFETGNLEGWTNTNAETQTNKAFDNVQGEIYTQRWHFTGAVDINQTLTCLPAGFYEISAYSYFSETGARLYANGTEVSVSTSNKYSVIVEIADKGSIILGASCASTSTSWWCVDDFTLTYLGTASDLTYTLAEGKMGTDKFEAQSEAETAFLANKTVANYNALLTAIAEAEASVVNYATLKTAIDKAEAVKDANNFVTAAAATALTNEISTATSAWTDVTYTDAECTTEIATLGSTVSGWHAIADEGVSGAYLASTWSKTHENWFDTPYINTWSNEGDNDGSGFSVPFFEYYTGDTDNLAANTFTATLSGLANGMYEVEIWARVQRRTDANFNGDNSMITMSVNGGEAVSIMNGDNIAGYDGTHTMRLGRFAARGMVTDGTLTLSIDVKLGSNVHWLSWRDITYTKLNEASMKISDAQWATFVAPFDVTIPDGVTAYTVNDLMADGTTLNLNEIETGTISANTPVILYKEEALDATSFYGHSVDGEPTEGLLTGVYTNTAAPAGSYVLQNNNGIIGFYLVEKGQEPNVGANRAYLTVPAQSGDVKAAFYFDIKTAINNVFSGVQKGDIYDLNGRKVSKMQKGNVYIVNGQKVSVK